MREKGNEMKLILQYIRKHLAIFLLSTFFLTTEAMADLLQPTFMSLIVDKGIKNADLRQILFFGLCMLCIAAAGAFCAVMRNRFASLVSYITMCSSFPWKTSTVCALHRS